MNKKLLWIIFTISVLIVGCASLPNGDHIIGFHYIQGDTANKIQACTQPQPQRQGIQYQNNYQNQYQQSLTQQKNVQQPQQIIIHTAPQQILKQSINKQQTIRRKQANATIIKK